MEQPATAPALTHLIYLATTLVCLFVVVFAYEFCARRWLHKYPTALLILGLVFMFIATVLYAYALPGMSRPIDVSIAAIGGNLVASAFVARAAREHNAWSERTQREVDRLKMKYAILTKRRDELPLDHPDCYWLTQRLSDIEETMENLGALLK
ncbi:MAG: hypothetical protein DYH18_00905 [Xanthomonadales bacterium PRO7]|nr:hypothetical protein [Xanthomonadales bacterium PRO7]